MHAPSLPAWPLDMAAARQPAGPLTIGRLAAITGASVRSIRHYERNGLLLSTRLSNGYRRFDASAIEFVARIRVLLHNGFTLDEIRPIVSMLGLPRDRRSVCADVIRLYECKLAELDQRIAHLQQIHRSASQRLGFLRRQREAGGPEGASTAP